MKAIGLRLRLTRGISDQRGFTLRPGPGRALFRVGSAVECNWRVHGPSIAPHHLMLMWSGSILTLVDVGAGDLWIDGEAFVQCKQIHEGRIQFGTGEILVSDMSGITDPDC